MKYKGHNILDTEINKLMKKLDLTLEEACETILCDMGIEEDETVEELSKKALKNRVTTTIHQAKGTNAKNERKAKEKKENPLKKQIINAISDGIYAKLDTFGTNNIHYSIRNDEKYIDLEINERSFTINLVEHRQKKGE